MNDKILLKEIYTDKTDTSHFDVVGVLAEDDDHMVGVSVTETGKVDGWELIAKDNVFLIEYDTPYCKELEGKSDFEVLSESDMAFDSENNIYDQFLNCCINKGVIVQIELCGSNLIDVEGKVQSADGRMVEICLEENGENAGYAMAAADSITRIFYRINE